MSSTLFFCGPFDLPPKLHSKPEICREEHFQELFFPHASGWSKQGLTDDLNLFAVSKLLFFVGAKRLLHYVYDEPKN